MRTNIGVAALALAIAIVGCSRKAPPVPEGKGATGGGAASPTKAGIVTFSAAQVLHGGVRWQPAAMGEAVRLAVLPGRIVPNEDRTARLGAPARGRIVAVSAAPGDGVARGQSLVTMQSADAGTAQSDFAKAEADLASREAQATYARAARERAERLLVLKAMPRQDYERAVADDELARGAVMQGRAELTRTRTAVEQLGASASPSGMITIRAPFPGVVLTRYATPGTVVDAGTPLVVVTDPSNLWLLVASPEQLAGLFRVSASLRFTVPAYPVDTFVALTQSVGAGLDPETRTLPIRAVIRDERRRLKAEMLASVLSHGAAVQAVMVPDSAVQLVDGKPSVFIATPGEGGSVRLSVREVEVGERVDGAIPVFRGLSAGEMVVIAGAFAVKAQLAKGTSPMEM